MKRATITGVDKPLLVKNYPIPPAPKNGMLIKVLASGVCFTDLHLIHDQVSLGNGKFWRHRDVVGDDGFIGITPGHEICGTVLELGSEVPAECQFKVGDNVMVYPWRGCRSCDLCINGKSNYCEFNKATCTDIGKGMDGFKHGGYQSHLPLLEWQNAVKLPKSISPEVGCMLPCSGLTTYSALEKARQSIELGIRVRGKANLMIIGSGGLGLWTVANARTLFGDMIRIICADISEDKLKLAKEYGADDTIQFLRDAAPEDLIAMVTRLTKMDAVLDIVGSPSTLKVAFHSLHNGGTLVPLGLSGGEIVLPTPNIIGRSIAIRGSRTGDIQELQTLTDIYEKKGLSKSPPVVYFNIDDVNDALGKLHSGKIDGRAVLKFD